MRFFEKYQCYRPLTALEGAEETWFSSSWRSFLWAIRLTSVAYGCVVVLAMVLPSGNPPTSLPEWVIPTGLMAVLLGNVVGWVHEIIGNKWMAEWTGGEARRTEQALVRQTIWNNAAAMKGHGKTVCLVIGMISFDTILDKEVSDELDRSLGMCGVPTNSIDGWRKSIDHHDVVDHVCADRAKEALALFPEGTQYLLAAIEIPNGWKVCWVNRKGENVLKQVSHYFSYEGDSLWQTVSSVRLSKHPAVGGQSELERLARLLVLNLSAAQWIKGVELVDKLLPAKQKTTPAAPVAN
jgi:hypothetical protein